MNKCGIYNIVEYAKKICGDNRIIDIVEGTLKYMKELQLNEVHACHCTDLNSKIALSKVINLKEVGVELTLEYK